MINCWMLQTRFSQLHCFKGQQDNLHVTHRSGLDLVWDLLEEQGSNIQDLGSWTSFRDLGWHKWTPYIMLHTHVHLSPPPSEWWELSSHHAVIRQMKSLLLSFCLNMSLGHVEKMSQLYRFKGSFPEAFCWTQRSPGSFYVCKYCHKFKT